MNAELKEKPLVSIIINCHNGEPFLKECLQSIIFQTYDNWEIIFWDNKSNDKSAEIFKSYKDNRFKYFHAKEYTSLYKARNLAIQEAKGELISFIDVDDIWEKNKLEIQVPLFNDKKISLVYSNLWLIKQKTKNKKKFIKKETQSGFIYNNLLAEYNVGIITVVFRRNIIKNLSKIFDERLSIIGDFVFFLNLSKKYYFHYIHMPLAYYRIHDKNFSSVYKEKEMDEFNIWAEENENNISIDKIKKIRKKISFRKFLHFKFNKDYINCFKILITCRESILFFKMFIIIFIPVFFLKKISWFHN